MTEIDHLIIGAGISGLSYAMHCKGEYEVYEKENEPGGLCRTVYDGEFMWDYAEHFFHFNTKELIDFFDAHIPADRIVSCEKNAKICYHGEYLDYPFQMNIHQLPKEEFIECLYDLFHRPKGEAFTDFEDMLFHKFGRGITEKFLKPYNEKLYACGMSELDPDCMGRFFPYASPEQIIDNMKPSARPDTYNNTFTYPIRGAKTFVDVLLSEMDEKRLHLGAEVSAVDPDTKTAVVNGQELRYRKLISTIPLKAFIRLLPEKYRGALTNLHANRELVLNLGFDRKSTDCKGIHWMYYPGEERFFRTCFYDNILGTDKLCMCAEIGFDETEEIEIEKELERTLQDLKKARVISEEMKLLKWNSLLLDPAYVHITRGSKETVEHLSSVLSGKEIYLLGRYAKWTYMAIEDCLTDAKELAEVLQ